VSIDDAEVNEFNQQLINHWINQSFNDSELTVECAQCEQKRFFHQERRYNVTRPATARWRNSPARYMYTKTPVLQHVSVDDL